MICQECGMRNKSRKCNLCGHVSKRTIAPSESTVDTMTSAKYRIDTDEAHSKTTKSIQSTGMDKLSDFWTPKPLEKSYNKIVRVIQITIVVIMIINAFPVLFHTVFWKNISSEYSVSTSYNEDLEENDWLADPVTELDRDFFDITDVIDTSTTGIYESSQLIKDFISNYIPDKINSVGWEEFEMSLFGTEYEVEAEISCYGGEWYDIYIQMYDVDNEIVDPYLQELFADYGGECVEKYEEYGCELWQFSDGISIELYFYEYEGEPQHYTSMYIINDNWYDHALED